MAQLDNTNKESEPIVEYVGKPAYLALYRRIKGNIDGLRTQLMAWAINIFVQSINGKSGPHITIVKGDIGLGNVDNTADKDKFVSHAINSDNADKIDGKHAADFMTKNEHKEYESVVDSAIADLYERKVDKEIGKGLSTNDFTNELLHKLDGIESGAEKNTVTSVAGKIGDVTISKDDVGLGNVDNTADKDKFVAHAVTADNAYTLGGKPAADFMLKSEHDEYDSVIATALTDLDQRKVDKVKGKWLSSNDYTTDEKNKLAGIEDGAQKNTVTSVAGKTGDVTLNVSNIEGLQIALNNKQDNLSFTSAPSNENKVVTQQELNIAVTGATNYLGTIDSSSSLSTTAKKGDFYRVRTAWTGVHVGDMIIAEKDNPSAIIDGINWSLMHNEMDTDTTYTFNDGTDGFSVTPSVGTTQKVNVSVKTVNGHSVNSDVPANAKFTDTIIDNVAGDGIAVSGDHGENISLNADTKNAIADAKEDHTKLGGFTIGKDVPSNAVFTDTIIDNVAGYGISVSGTHGETISLDSETQTAIANSKTDHVNLGGHTVGKDIPSDAVFTDYQATKAGHYYPADERTLSPNTSVLRDHARDMAFVGAVHQDEKGHVISIETCAILAFTDAEIEAAIDQAMNEINSEMI